VPVLVAALSARALAAAVRRGGEEVIPADLFGDEDTRRLGPWHAIGAGLAAGIERGRLLAVLDATKGDVSGLAYGAGFEGGDGLLEALAARATLLGNAPETVRRVKDPFALASLLAHLGIPHPEIRAAPPCESGWLRKRAGAAGGTHVAPADAPPFPPRALSPQGEGTFSDGVYFQRRAPGVAVSALFVGDGRRAAILGFSGQWTAPAPDASFRYGGCAGPLLLPPRLAGAIGEAAAAIVAATGLAGLNSLDLLVEEDRFCAIEINPRPGATLDIFDSDDRPLWPLHRAGLAGRLPDPPPPLRAFRAAAVAYAAAPLRVPRLAWPRWAADRPPPGSAIGAGEPICTVLAEEATLDAAEATARARTEEIVSRVSKWPEADGDPLLTAAMDGKRSKPLA
jgi:uncharacterized protein